MPVPKFVFVRHGEAEHNVASHNGLGDKAFTDPKYKNAPLTAKGKEQARATGEALFASERRFLDIWCSPLTRCIETAEEIYEEINCAELWLHDSLVERLGGGHVCNERHYTSNIKKMFPCWKTDFLPEFPPLWVDRENQTSLQRRMLSFILLLAEMYKNVREGFYVLIVGHADAIFSLTHVSLKNAEYVEMSLEEILAVDKPTSSPWTGSGAPAPAAPAAAPLSPPASGMQPTPQEDLFEVTPPPSPELEHHMEEKSPIAQCPV
jgi:broad specificity phosphatase PhoE